MNEQRTGVKGVYNLYNDLEECGDVRIKRYIYDADNEHPLVNIMNARDGAAFMRMYDGGYVKMIVGNELMMSDTVMERNSNYNFIYEAHGRVLIAGLGLGMVLHNILNRERVKHITVVEINKNVIKLVAPKFVHPKLDIVHGDIFEYRPQEKFDSIYFDIWPGIRQDNLDDIRKLHARFKFKKNAGGMMDSWMKEYLQKVRARENRNKYW
jgi:spermidine synthase